jgi:hypothetical protein
MCPTCFKGIAWCCLTISTFPGTFLMNIIDDDTEYSHGLENRYQFILYTRERNATTHFVHWGQFHSRFFVLHLNLICFYERPLWKQCEMLRYMPPQRDLRTNFLIPDGQNLIRIIHFFRTPSSWPVLPGPLDLSKWKTTKFENLRIVSKATSYNSCNLGKKFRI